MVNVIPVEQCKQRSIKNGTTLEVKIHLTKSDKKLDILFYTLIVQA